MVPKLVFRVHISPCEGPFPFSLRGARVLTRPVLSDDPSRLDPEQARGQEGRGGSARGTLGWGNHTKGASDLSASPFEPAPTDYHTTTSSPGTHEVGPDAPSSYLPRRHFHCSRGRAAED